MKQIQKQKIKGVNMKKVLFVFLLTSVVLAGCARPQYVKDTTNLGPDSGYGAAFNFAAQKKFNDGEADFDAFVLAFVKSSASGRNKNYKMRSEAGLDTEDLINSARNYILKRIKDFDPDKKYRENYHVSLGKYNKHLELFNVDRGGFASTYRNTYTKKYAEFSYYINGYNIPVTPDNALTVIRFDYGKKARIDVVYKIAHCEENGEGSFNFKCQTQIEDIYTKVSYFKTTGNPEGKLIR